MIKITRKCSESELWMKRRQVVIYSCFIFCWPQYSFAYIDPGSGSLILQGIIAGVAMGLYTIKLYWYKLKNLFKRGDKITKNDIDDDED